MRIVRSQSQRLEELADSQVHLTRRRRNCSIHLMRYKVSFRKRFTQEGEAAEHPVVSLSLPDGVVQEALIVESELPGNLHVEERMEEDDDFLSLGTEAWEFDITPGREAEFIQALERSQTALEYEEVNDEAA